MAGQADAAVDAAWAYERLHVAALFQQWAEPVLDAAGVSAGDAVLDVACGTGVVGRAAHARAGPRGSVTGLDVDAGMLAVAESLEPGVRWVEGEAGHLPFDDDSFDAVGCAFGLMFFPDPGRAVSEMLRCLRGDGRAAVAVWDALEHTQAYPLVVDLLERRAGPGAAQALRAPFALGDTGRLRALLADAGATVVSLETRRGRAEFPSVRSMVEAELRGWLPVMGVHLEEALMETILREADDVLGAHVAADGTMAFDVAAHVAVVRA